MNKLRKAAEAALEALDKLSRLGNGDIPGNSIGNCIAQDAAEKLRAALAEPEVAGPIAWRFTHNRGNGKIAYTYHDNTPENDYRHAYLDTCLEITKLYLYECPIRELTNAEIVEIAQRTQTADPGTDGYILPVSFAREIIKELSK